MEIIFHINEKLQIKTLPAVILYYSTLSGTNRQILTPTRYQEHPRHFYRRVLLRSSATLQTQQFYNITMNKIN